MRASTIVPGILFVLAAPAAAQEALPSKAPAPADNPVTAAKVRLGKMLYFDPRLSKDGTVSCFTCHNVMAGGADNRSVSVGIGGQKGGRSAPTVFNAAFLSVQFWDGRAPTLEEQAKGPLVNPVEMGNKDHDEVVARIRQIPGYVEEFKKAFGGKEPVTIDNYAKAVASYERTLITPNSPFDRFVKGDKQALSLTAQRGWKKVQETGCLACHMGPNFAGPPLPVGTGFYQKFPTYPGSEYDDKYDLTDDSGRYEATKNDADKGLFRVQTWRNVALNAPYFHNGSVQTLDEAVRVMAKTQLNKDLPDADVKDIVAFLESLTGRIPEQTMPVLPPTPGRTVVDPR